MRYLLDTCVISELVKRKPNPKVIDWVEEREEENLYLSVLILGELQKGISKLPTSPRKQQLQSWLEQELYQRFEQRVLEVTREVAKRWGEIQAKAEQEGRVMSAIDSLISATGLVYGMTVVTRNIEDMEASGVQLFNPWN